MTRKKRSDELLPRPLRRRYLSADEYETIDRLWLGGENATAICQVIGGKRDRTIHALAQLGHTFVKRPACVTRERHGFWNGGRVEHGGYWRVYVMPDDAIGQAMKGKTAYVPEHRLVMAHALGRALAPSETVHHRNGDRADNRIENLQLRQGRHGKGAAFRCCDCGSTNVEATAI